MTKIFFADTYALLEIINGNKNYKNFLIEQLVTSKYNLIELYYVLLRDFGKKIADKYVDFYSYFTLPVSYSAIKLGMELKLQFRKEKLSYIDCVGWALACENKIKFLTGDQKFETKPNVEFVK